MNNLIPRLRRYLRRHGLRSTVGRAAHHVRSRVYLRETHVWYELRLGAAHPRVALPPELTLVRGGEDDLALLAELPTAPIEEEARRRMEAGADLWLVLDDHRLAFACWVFHGLMPMIAAPGGQLVLPPEIVCLENSIASAAYRGRGIAPAAWSSVADELEPSEAEFIVTKIEESNTPSRRAIVKSGFHESATMHFRRIGFRQRTSVQAGTGATANWLTKQLQH